jgi:hypothetical protein
VSGDAWAVVARWLAELPTAPETPLCPNRRGQALTVNGLQERLRHYAAQAGVTLRCHQLRHTFARQMVEHEMPVTSLSKMLGHDSLSTTQVYSTGADPALRETYQRAMQAWETDAPAAPPAQPAPASFPVIASPALPDERAWPTFAEWALDLPAWVREPCRDAARVHRAMRDWKVSQRQRQGRRRLQELAQREAWRWQLKQRAMTAWSELTRAREACKPFWTHSWRADHPRPGA